MYRENERNRFITKWKNKIQYLSDNCSLQVLGYVISPSRVPLFKRIFWLVTIIACCVCSVIVLRGALSLYTSDAVSYSVETNYLEFDTPFPAVTICEYWTDLVHKKLVLKYLHEKNLSSSLVDFAHEVIFWDPIFCKTCATCKLNKTCIADFMDLVNNNRKKCTEMLNRCSWGDDSFSCCERFLPIETEYGTCYVFNSELTDSNTLYTVNQKVGLLSLTFEAIFPVMLRVHSSGDMLSAASDKVLSRCDKLPLISDLDLILSAEQTVSDVSVQRLAPSSRDCLFENERPEFAHLWPFKRYSLGACLLYSRAITQAEACNCTHHLMPSIGDYPKCDISGLVCFQKNKGKLATDKYFCPMTCDEVMYKVIHVTCPRHSDKVQDNRTHSHGTRAVIRLGHLPTLRVRRHAIRELLGLVASAPLPLSLAIHGLLECSQDRHPDCYRYRMSLQLQLHREPQSFTVSFPFGPIVIKSGPDDEILEKSRELFKYERNMYSDLGTLTSVAINSGNSEAADPAGSAPGKEA